MTRRTLMGGAAACGRRRPDRRRPRRRRRGSHHQWSAAHDRRRRRGRCRHLRPRGRPGGRPHAAVRCSSSRPVTGSAAACSTTRLGTGDTIESGGAFVGPTQDHIIALANELKVPMFEEYVDGKSVYNSSGPLGRQEYDGTVPPDPLILPDAAILQYQLDQWASEIDVDAPWNHPRAKEWDSMTLGDYIRSARGQPERHRQPDQLLDPARLRCRPRPALAAVRHPLRRLLRQRDHQGHLRAQLRHRRRRAGATLHRRLAADPAAAGRPARLAGRAQRRRSPGSTRPAPTPSYAPAAERSPASASSWPCRPSSPARSSGVPTCRPRTARC